MAYAKKTNHQQMLFHAINTRNEPLLEELIRISHIDVNSISDNFETPLIMAIRLGFLEGVYKLLSCSDLEINQKVPLIEHTALIVLVKSQLPLENRIKILKRLLNFPGLDINIRDTTGAAAISYAAMKGDYEVLRLLYGANADINIPCIDGDTPLHYAVRNQHIEMTNFLLKKGANPFAERISDRITPLDLSRDTPLKDLIEGRFTSHTHPYRIDFIDASHCALLGPCIIGMGMCPGRQYHHNWSRDLIMDVQVLKKHEVELVVTLMRHDELNRMQLSDLTTVYAENGMESIHFPITDKWLPDSIDDFCECVNRVVGLIKEGRKMLVHCNGGKGRTGLLIVGCLIKLGLTQQEATEIIRTVRPGMLRNPAQQVYLMWIDAKLRNVETPRRLSWVVDTIGNFLMPQTPTTPTITSPPPTPEHFTNQSRPPYNYQLPELPFANYK